MTLREWLKEHERVLMQVAYEFRAQGRQNDSLITRASEYQCILRELEQSHAPCLDADVGGAAATDKRLVWTPAEGDDDE